MAQKPCEISTNVSDSIGTYKATKDYLLYEKNFAEKSSYIFASLILVDGIPALTIQSIDKSKDFINGILDRLLKQLAEEGKISKEGRGLIGD